MSSMGSPVDAAGVPPTDPMALARLLVRHELHPELELHPSWLPVDWPARHRRVERLGPAAREVLADLLRREHPDCDRADTEAPLPDIGPGLRRLALLDVTSLRRLALYTGLCAHQPFFRARGGLGSELRRQARRIDTDAADFVVDRMPHLSEVRMNPKRLQERPVCAGRVVVDRGYRLLLATVLPEGEAVFQRLRRKLPRRVALSGVSPLNARQHAQLQELMLLCLIPERLPQWDWLF